TTFGLPFVNLAIPDGRGFSTTICDSVSGTSYTTDTSEMLPTIDSGGYDNIAHVIQWTTSGPGTVEPVGAHASLGPYLDAASRWHGWSFVAPATGSIVVPELPADLAPPDLDNDQWYAN